MSTKQLTFREFFIAEQIIVSCEQNTVSKKIYLKSNLQKKGKMTNLSKTTDRLTRTKNKIYSVKYILFFISFFQQSAFSQPIDRGNYYIAISHDGNSHDEDDFLAAPLNIAMLSELELWNKVLHFEYNNNIGGQKPGSPDQMRESVNGALEKWAADKSKVFDLQTLTMVVSQAAKDNFKNAAQTAFDQGAVLYYACLGPMEVPYQMIFSLPENLRKTVHVVTHGNWNPTFKRQPTSRDWTDLINIAGKSTIISQNQNGTYFNEPITDWEWFNKKGGRYSWLFSRNTKSPDFDASDAGVVYYIITGRGNIKSTQSDIQPIFSKSLSFEQKAIVSQDSVYPNPASSYINIDFADNNLSNEVKLLNILGQLLYKTTSSKKSLKIDLSSLHIKGQIFVQISNTRNQSKHKILVE